MAIKIQDYKPTPSIPHVDYRGKRCGGYFKFLGPITSIHGANDRKCSWCDRWETYDPDRVIIVGKSGITPAALREYGSALVVKIEKLSKKKFLQLRPVIEIQQDRSNPQRYAAILEVEGIGLDAFPEKFLIEIGTKVHSTTEPPLPYFEDIIEWVWRKPLVYRHDQEKIPYTP